MQKLENLSALLVYSQDGVAGLLQPALEKLGIRTERAQTQAEAELLLTRGLSPALIFTEAGLPDGSWANILTLAKKFPLHPRVIVVSKDVDMKLYLDALEKGASDFMIPPFDPSGVEFIVREALMAHGKSSGVPPAA
jgi:DNA-binding NtrC family response regulator